MMKLSHVCAGVAAALLAFGPARAEVSEVLIARQFGLQYLPMVLMEKHKLIEKAAAAEKIGLKATWLQISAASMNESLLSGSINISATGVGPMVLIWDRTRDNFGVKAIAAVSEVPMVLTSRNPSFTSMKTISSKDRIAVPAVGLGSMQALTLKMATAQLNGIESVGKYDVNTISMAHPDATAAMLSGQHEVNAHFTTPPYSYTQLKDPRIHKVMSSYDILGGQATLIVISTTSKFYTDNPKVMQAVVTALQEAAAMANADRKKAIAEYMEVTKEKLPPDVIEAFVADKDIYFDTTPRGIYKTAEFMSQIGAIKNKPATWQDLFFSAVHRANGS